MAEAMYFGVGQDEDGYFYAVKVRGRYMVSPERWATMAEAVTALFDEIDKARDYARAWSN